MLRIRHRQDALAAQNASRGVAVSASRIAFECIPPRRAGRAGAQAWNGPTGTSRCSGSASNLIVACTRARFTDSDPAGNRIPGAPASVASAALTFARDTGWFGAIKSRCFGPRPLIEDDSAHSLASLIFNARLGYRFGKRTARPARRAGPVLTPGPTSSIIITCHACRASRSRASATATSTPPSRWRSG
jgi:hypothetical protein